MSTSIARKKYWFKAKHYGWGWYPVSWQGWLVIGIYVVLFFANFRRVDLASHSASDTLLNLVPQTAVLTLILIFICYKTGEWPRWRWGGKDL